MTTAVLGALIAPWSIARAGELPRLQLTPLALAADEAPPAPGDTLDFDLLGESKPKEASPGELRLEAQRHTRRRMLTVHQGLGLSTLALMTATVVVGQLNYMDRFSAGQPTNTARYELTHEVLAFTTIGTFTATGLLGLLAPVPDDKPRRFDTIAVHKLAMGGATLGMLTQTGLGLYTETHEGLANQRSFAQLHQVVGYTTLGLMLVGAGALLFE